MNIEPTLVRHKPRRHLVQDQRFCSICGGLGHYFFINDRNHHDIFVADCKNLTCSDPERAGVPPPTDPAPTDRIEVFDEEEDGPRGIRYGRNNLVTTSDAISGSIIVSRRRLN